jgi:hypothetical protein
MSDAAQRLVKRQCQRDVYRPDALVDVAQQLGAKRLRLGPLNELLGHD